MSNRGRHKKKLTKYSNTWLTKILSDEILNLIFLRAKQQGNRIDLQMIERTPTSSNIIVWCKTPEGWDYWCNIFNQVVKFKLKMVHDRS